VEVGSRETAKIKLNAKHKDSNSGGMTTITKDVRFEEAPQPQPLPPKKVPNFNIRELTPDVAITLESSISSARSGLSDLSADERRRGLTE